MFINLFDFKMKKTHVGVETPNLDVSTKGNHKFYRLFPYLGIVLVIGLTIHTVSAWVEPDQMPPGGNIAAPINTGNTGQIKTGGLILNTGGATLGLIVDRGLVGIGTNNPQATLDVNGTIRGTGLNITGNADITGKINAKEIYANGVLLSGDNVPLGTIAYFDLDACPTGWTEVTDARGRYLVGEPAGGTRGFSSMTGQSLTSQENRSVGQHNHDLIDPGHTHGFPSLIYNGAFYSGNSYAIAGSSLDSTASSIRSSKTGITINPVGLIPGTNAPYIQYLICKKTSGGSNTSGSTTTTTTTTTESFWQKAGLGGDIYFNGGNVGIGTNVPTKKLDVAGDINASGTVSAGNSICLRGDCRTGWPSSGKLIVASVSAYWTWYGYEGSSSDYERCSSCPSGYTILGVFLNGLKNDYSNAFGDCYARSSTSFCARPLSISSTATCSALCQQN